MNSSAELARRSFLSLAGKGLGLAALSFPAVASLLQDVHAATKSVAHLSPAQAAMNEDYWSVIQNSFTVTRGIINLNNGGVSPSPRIVTEALVRRSEVICLRNTKYLRRRSFTKSFRAFGSRQTFTRRWANSTGSVK